MTDLYQIKAQMRKEHRILKTRKFFRNKSVVIGAAVLLIMLALAVLAPVISPYDPLEVNVVNRLKSPCKEFIFGTDTFGRDLLSRILYGTSISMKVGVLVSGFSFVIGLFLGLYSGYYPKFGAVVMRFCDAVKAIPSLMLAIALVGVMGAGEKNVILTLIIVSIPDITRVARSITLQVKEQTYIEALQASGRKQSAHHLAQYHAERHPDGAGAGLLHFRDRRHLGGVAELPRRGHPDAGAELGQYYQ